MEGLSHFPASHKHSKGYTSIAAWLSPPDTPLKITHSLLGLLLDYKLHEAWDHAMACVGRTPSQCAHICTNYLTGILSDQWGQSWPLSIQAIEVVKNFENHPFFNSQGLQVLTNSRCLLWTESCPQKFIGWSSNPLYLRMWLRVESGSLKRWLRGGHAVDPDL